MEMLDEESKRLRESESKLRAVFENTAVGLAILDMEGRLVESNLAFREMLGYAEEELRGVSLSSLSRGEDGGIVPSELERTGRDHHRMERRFVRRDGEVLWASVTVSLPRDPDGDSWSAVAAMEDITERKAIEESLEESEHRFRQLFENSVDALFVHDDRGRIQDCNAEACRSLGYTREELLELSVRDFVVDVIPEEESARGEDTPWRRAILGRPGEIVGFHENWHRRKDGSTFPVEVALSAMDYKGQRMIFASARDVTDRRAFEERLAHQAFHDPLTQLPNRVLFMDRLEQALARVDRNEKHIALMFLDLDNFKLVNDSRGHDVGDRLLTEVGRRLSSCVRASDTVARLGGDEFTLLLEGLDDMRDAELVAERIEESIRAPFEIDGHELTVTASIGVVFAGRSDAASAASRAGSAKGVRDLLQEVDRAMYLAKGKGKDRYEIHGPDDAGSRSV